jgi:hypothetical protein
MDDTNLTLLLILLILRLHDRQNERRRDAEPD